MVFLRVGDSDVFMCCLYKLLPQLFFEFWRSSIKLHVLQVLVELQLVKLLFLKLPEGLLDRYLGLQLLQQLVFFVSGLFHLKGSLNIILSNIHTKQTHFISHFNR